MPSSPAPGPRRWPLLAALAAAMAVLWTVTLVAVQASTCEREATGADWLPCLAVEQDGPRAD
ncbi:hypothetical protein [Micrococcus sp.]|uniref:hypothetical protein n=1 Tax=Micrococcus sp. TaxID=1271 RepID=UPI0026DDB551|nr:hypothetical protein [Micrococcus sp.]MDO4240061.1 hypothetical protein [Micrococcus sp.]